MPPIRSVPPSRPTGPDLAALARLSALATLLGLTLVVLLDLGGRLPIPSLSLTAIRSPDGWTGWLAQVGPAGATMSLVRLAAIALAAYLLGLVVIEVVGRAAGVPRLLALGHLVSTPLARQLIGGVAGVGLALSFAAASVGPAGATSVDPPTTSTTSTTTTVPAGPVMHALDPAEPTDGSNAQDRTTMTSLDSEPPVMRAVDASSDPPATTAPPDDAPPPTATSDVPPVARPPDPAAAPPVPTAPSPAPSPEAGRWVIRSGDHLWGVARRTLAGAWHRAPTDAETARYLDRLIEANVGVLVVPGDADLVLPGQEFELPPVPLG
jgi:hypothetical protein